MGMDTAKTAPGRLLITFSVKDGAGKSSLALAVARLSSEAGVSTVLIDSSTGSSPAFPRRGWDRMVENGPVRRTLISPEDIHWTYTGVRGPVRFDMVPASDAPLSRYAEIVDFCRQNYDLVVLDTQTVGSSPTERFTRFMDPAFAGAYFVGVSGPEDLDIDYMGRALNRLSNSGIPSHRVMLALTRVESGPLTPLEAANEILAEAKSNARYVGMVPTDESVQRSLLEGLPAAKTSPFGPVAECVLSRILNDRQHVRQAS